MTIVSSGKAGEGERSDVTQAVFRQDSDEARSSALVAQDEEAESDPCYDIFENVDDDWTKINLNHEVPKEDHVKKAKQVSESSYTERMKDISGKLQDKAQEKAQETAEQVVEASAGYATAGLGYVAEKIGYYANSETAQNLVQKLRTRSPFLVDLKTAFFRGRNDAVRDRRQRKKTIAERLAVNYSYPTRPRIWDPRNAPQGTHMGRGAVLGSEGRAGGSAALVKDDQDDGEMEDIPLTEDEEQEWDKIE